MKKFWKGLVTFGLVASMCAPVIACGDTTTTSKTEQEKVYAAYVAYAETTGEEVLSYEDWLATIKGENGLTPFIGENGNWWIGTTDTGVSAKGAKGDTGAQGEQGIQGEKGDTGATGATGAQGIQGEKGDKGDKGDTGATGATGAQGAQGEKGDKGDKGDTGATGAAGKDGTNGTNGEDGQDGEDGLTPFIGENGN